MLSSRVHVITYTKNIENIDADKDKDVIRK